MKRSLAVIGSLVLTVVAWAQAPFTIVRPVDGAKVREVVRIQIPKGSIPEGSYVGIFVGGKFVEATILDLKGKYYEYPLDTKKRGIADGKVKLEVVLYRDMAEKPMIVDRSSVEVDVQNVVSIPIPEDGFQLRYKFVPGTELNYTITDRTSVSTITVGQAQRGGRAAMLPLDFDSWRMMYAIDNRYGDGDGLIRMQALPAKNKDYAILRTIENPEGKKFMDYEMHPLYMRVTNTGREKFGSVPLYVPLEGTAGESRTDLFAVYPLPTLPTKNVKPGDAWEAPINIGMLNLDDFHNTSRLTYNQKARGELLGVEWEMGHPCAKLKYSISAGMQGRTGRDKMGDDNVQLEQTVYFALDRGIVLKSVLDITRDIKAETQAAPAGGGGSGSQPSRPGIGMGGGPGGGGRGGRGGVGPDGDRSIGGAPPQDPSGGGAPGAQGGGRFGQGGGGRTGGGGNPTDQLLRIRQQLTFVLER